METLRIGRLPITVVGVAFALLMAGCGGAETETTTTAAAAAETTTTAAAAAETTTTAAAETTTTSVDSDALFARGEDLFQKSAGGVGCQACHGTEGRGDVGIGPNIQGMTVKDINTQLQTNEDMEFLRASLTEEDIEAVAVYLAYLKETFG